MDDELDRRLAEIERKLAQLADMIQWSVMRDRNAPSRGYSPDWHRERFGLGNQLQGGRDLGPQFGIRRG